MEIYGNLVQPYYDLMPWIALVQLFFAYCWVHYSSYINLASMNVRETLKNMIWNKYTRIVNTGWKRAHIQPYPKATPRSSYPKPSRNLWRLRSYKIEVT